MKGKVMYRYLDPQGMPLVRSGGGWSSTVGDGTWYFMVDLDQNPTGAKDAGGMSLESPVLREALLAFLADNDLDVKVLLATNGFSTEFRRFR